MGEWQRYFLDLYPASSANTSANTILLQWPLFQCGYGLAPTLVCAWIWICFQFTQGSNSCMASKNLPLKTMKKLTQTSSSFSRWLSSELEQ